MVKKLLLKLRPFLFSIRAWAGAIGLFILIRRVGSESLVGWAPDAVTLFLIWIVSSVLLGVTFEFITLIGETPTFRSRPFGEDGNCLRAFF